MYSQYTMTVIEHFMSPRNAGSLKDYSGKGQYGDMKCGDSLTIYLDIKEDVIVDIGYLIFGCTAAIATSSMLSVMARGKTVEEAKNITEEELVEALGGLPDNKLHCSVLGVKALRSAIEDYEKATE